jgi:hypothetical protein
MTRALPVSLLISCAFLSGCDIFYGPCIANAYARPATFKASYANTRPVDAILPSGTIFWQRAPGQHLVALAFTADGDHRAYTAAALDRVRAEHPVTQELWIIGPQGLKLEDLHDIREIRKRLPEPQKT